MTKLFTALTFATLAGVAPAAAETNVWKTGQSYTIRTTDIDQSSADGRAALLRRVDHAGRKLCAGRAPRIAFDACVTQSRGQVLASGPAITRRALALALAERDGTRMAAR